MGEKMLNKTQKIIGRYDRVAKVYDIFDNAMDMMIPEERRKELFEDLSGKVLEIGVGTGKNIMYYPETVEMTAIDFSSKMLNKAKVKSAKLNKKVNLILMDAQQMDFQDNTFDYIIATCVFCSVPDPIKGFLEMKRVLKPGGKIILIEHVISENKLLGILMNIMNPITVYIYGANINRLTEANIKAAGLDNIKVTNLWRDIVKKFVITNIK